MGSMNLMVLTAAVFPSEEEARKKLWVFLKSCEKFGVEPHLYGVGRTFPGYRAMKLDMQLEWLKAYNGDATHVLYTDSWDAFFCAPFEEILLKYWGMGLPPILTAAYTGLANVPEPDKDYPHLFDELLAYRYPHVGGYIAEIPAIIDAFERMLALPRQTGDDCFNWYDLWQQGWRPKIDSECHIFQVTDANCEVTNFGTRIKNRVTGSYPCILHLSGGFTDQATGKDRTMIPWAKTLGVIE